ncbi:MAG: hypothetical protein QOH68_3147 [Nocardioidaceae bacterium]|jgi:hypothetical protein|nr:hypothetical protein [Nocardioidaceae bacterium]
MTTNEPPPYPGEPNPSANDPQSPPPLPSYGSVQPPEGSYPPPPPGAYPPPAPGGYGAPPELNKKALWSMITGIVSIVGLCCTFGGLIGIASIILGLISRGEIARSNGAQTGSGMSTAGIVTGAVGILGFIVIIVLIATGAVDTNYSSDFN